MNGRMTDRAERKGGARRAWPKGATAQMGHASKLSPLEKMFGNLVYDFYHSGLGMKKTCRLIILLLMAFGSASLSANPYTLEYSLTGSETVTLESDSYTVEAGWGEPSVISDTDPYEAHPEVYAYISLYTDFLTGDSAVLLSDGAEVQPGWKKTGWFGFFYADFYPWVYHQNLGWIYVSENSGNGAWFNHKRLGWIWTNSKVFPSLYINKRTEWAFLDKTKNSPILYDYRYREWFEADRPYTISTSAMPASGGTVSGNGQYYRWDRVVLQAVPSGAYKFSDWGGDLQGMESASIEFEATRNINADALFIPNITPDSSPGEFISGAMNALEQIEGLSADDRKKSVIELLSTGKSKTSGLSIVDSE